MLSRPLHLADVVDIVREDEALAEPAAAAADRDPARGRLADRDRQARGRRVPATARTGARRAHRPGTARAAACAARGPARGRAPVSPTRPAHDRACSCSPASATQRARSRAPGPRGAPTSATSRSCSGDPGEAPRDLAGPIAADPLVPGRFRVARGGRPARTRVRRLAAAGGLSLVEVHPLTGRTHQVRVHLAARRLPGRGRRALRRRRWAAAPVPARVAPHAAAPEGRRAAAPRGPHPARHGRVPRRPRPDLARRARPRLSGRTSMAWSVPAVVRAGPQRWLERLPRRQRSAPGGRAPHLNQRRR